MNVEIRVQPRSSKEAIVELGRDAYKIYMHEPAIDGKANKRLIEMLAGYFKTKKNKIRILKGARARTKIVEVIL
ncbi:MAG: hypothetical protein A2Z72_06575 [Omnitrophica bacterium RBG_13_46_9]|nr:MAG: hypothetical protein A2Z72_06575 [Omnitrophica bacterium RBG_13_46_9]